MEIIVKLGFVLFVTMAMMTTVKGTSCYTCTNNPTSNVECNNVGDPVTCASNEVCQNEIRDENGQHRIRKECKQDQACCSNAANNYNQCFPDGSSNPSVCRYCCIGEACNEDERFQSATYETCPEIATWLPEADTEAHCNVNDVGVCKAACDASETEKTGDNGDALCPGSQVCCADDGNGIGDPHYTTLDGLKFDNQGECSYIMLQDCIDTTPDWKIVIFNEKFKYSQIVSYISAVEIQLADHVIKLGPRDLVTVDRQTVADNIDHFDFDNEDLSLKKSNNNVVFYYRRTFSVSFNGIHRVDVAVSPDLKNKVCGLLGNNDGDPSNDMMKPNGDMATDADDFSKSWETEVCAE